MFARLVEWQQTLLNTKSLYPLSYKKIRLTQPPRYLTLQTVLQTILVLTPIS